ncbi:MULTISPECIES: cellulose-binding domain-containing protein [unclassified Streptomyces]|uniref:cellulose-binding domain-containing protein n=1 Tax=unclassified Streptomyces TaxID=2593676 RepID=UPI001F03355C|nr:MULTISPECIES: cellulose-binding domain-containing protein [unclassified Streptomyces]MCH0561594.1 cellulose-binding domain-containing protein [Streptomyces sp. MUM 2J]MCH0573404.1 cellulose-binding domain-containing protein [Streptomyces sp. MUM 136J]
MPDLPTPQDATEAAQFTECWDAVLSYADLCTSGSAAAQALAREAFALGLRQARDAEPVNRRAPGRRPDRLPRIPLLLTAVRTTAAGWEAAGEGHRLDPDLRLWLNSGRAARCTGPPQGRPLALRALRDLPETDAELLWAAEVEALPPHVAARGLGLDPAAAADALDQARTLFRDRCRRGHLDARLAAECRSYARLLDAVTRRPGTDTPDDLSRHLATCVDCAEAAACLRLHDGTLPAALAGGVTGWGGPAYLERRRRAAEARLCAGRPEDPAADRHGEADAGARFARGGLLVTAGLVSVLALAVSLMPFGSADDAAARPEDVGRRQATDAIPGLPPASPTPARTLAPRSTPSTPTPPPTTRATPATGTPPAGREAPAPEPQGTTVSTAPGQGGEPSAAAGCAVDYRVLNQWANGFQAAVTLTTADALDDWSVAWSFPDGQRITQMWDARFSQSGPGVTVGATGYSTPVPVGGTVSFGFLGTWQGRNADPKGFTLNGQTCRAG